MSKTFKSAVTKSGNRTLLVSTDIGMDAGFFVEVQDKHEGNFPICFNSDTAPALALAILEAAGYEERQKGWDVLNSADENFAQSMRCLSKGLELQERATAEAEAQAKLEAEALELLNASRIALHSAPVDELMAGHKLKWLAVARRAREINKDESNA